MMNYIVCDLYLELFEKKKGGPKTPVLLKYFLLFFLISKYAYIYILYMYWGLLLINYS